MLGVEYERFVVWGARFGLLWFVRWCVTGSMCTCLGFRCWGVGFVSCGFWCWNNVCVRCVGMRFGV